MMHKLCNLMAACFLLMFVSCTGNKGHFQIKPGHVKKIILLDGGIFDTYKAKVITNRDSMINVCKLINKTKLIDSDTIQIRRSSISIWVNIYTVENETIKILLKDTFENGSVIWYDGNTYQANELYQYVKQ